MIIIKLATTVDNGVQSYWECLSSLINCISVLSTSVMMKETIIRLLAPNTYCLSIAQG